MSAIPQPVDAPAAARQSGLRYVDSAVPGIRREPVKDGFRYADPEGKILSVT